MSSTTLEIIQGLAQAAADHPYDALVPSPAFIHKTRC